MSIKSLEMRYFERMQDTTRAQEFDDYREPNEGHPENVKPHLDRAGEGLLVSVGSERSFFNLALSDPNKCTGLVMVDLSERIYNYVQMNIILLRVSQDRREYATLSESVDRANPAALKGRVDVIRDKIQNNHDLPEGMQSFYLKNLETFAKSYFICFHDWKNKNNYDKCRYDLHDDQFNQLQTYAKSGRIIAIVGSINDLQFLRNQVAVIDTSNIYQYGMIDIRGGYDDFSPRIIYTLQNSTCAKFFSYQHVDLSPEERTRYEKYKQKLESAGRPLHNWLDTAPLYLNDLLIRPRLDDFSNGASSFCTRENLGILKRLVEADSLIEIPGVGVFDMDPYIGFFPHIINSLTDGQLDTLCASGEIQKHLDTILSRYKELNARPAIQLMGIPGWENAFEKAFNGHKWKIREFTEKLQKENAYSDFYESFSNQFGQEKLNQLGFEAPRGILPSLEDQSSSKLS
ncbi:MAG: hypothetical protein JSS61_06290 [Verrucomicrobia bacterium]|nr:hypothetical protein [Verrucomicrobiota bacterium]